MMYRTSASILRKTIQLPLVRSRHPVPSTATWYIKRGSHQLGTTTRQYSIAAAAEQTAPSEVQLNELQQNLRPSQIVDALNKYVVGQEDAKRAVAIALRNRWRRRQLPDDIRREIVPRNVLLVGPTGAYYSILNTKLFWIQSPLFQV